MNSTTRNGARGTTLAAAIAFMAGASAWAAFPLSEGFESYAPGTPLTNLAASGWGASTTGVVVETGIATQGVNAAYLPPVTTVTNTLTAVAIPKVWTDCYLRETNHTTDSTFPFPDTNTAVMVFLNTNGYVVLYNSNRWDVCSNDAWNVAVPATSTGAWARVSVYENFTNSQAAVFVNERLVRQQVPFIGAVAAYTQFQLDSGSSAEAYLDAVTISTNPPALAGDWDGDGTPDVAEVDLFGNVDTIHGPVITVITPTNGTVTPAGLVLLWPNGGTNFALTAASGYYVSEARTNGTSVGSFPGQLTNTASYVWTNVAASGTFQAIFARKPLVSGVATNLSGPQVAGTVSPTGPVDVFPGATVTFTLAANSGYYIADARENGVSIGGFPGQFTTSASLDWPNITADAQFTAVFARNPQVTALATNQGGPGAVGGTITPSGLQQCPPGGSLSFALAADVAFAVSAVLTNGSPAVTFDGQSRTAAYTYSNIWVDTTVTARFGYTGLRHVPGDYATIQSALTAAWVNDTILIDSGIYPGNLTVTNAVALQGTGLTIQGNVAVSSTATQTWVDGSSVSITGVLQVAAGGRVIIVNGAVTVGDLTIAPGGIVDLRNATLTILSAGVTFDHATRLLDNNWNTGGLVPSVVPFRDTFEGYAAGKSVSSLGFAGWGASSAGAVVETGLATQGVKAIELPSVTTVSNVFAPTNLPYVWMDCYLRDTNRVSADKRPHTDEGAAVLVCLDTNGYLNVYDPVNDWQVCAQDAMGNTVPPLPAGDWARITVFVNFASNSAAYFLNDRLMRERVPLIVPMTALSLFQLDSGSGGPAQLDDVQVLPSYPTNLLGSWDGDNIPDALEIQRHGTVSLYPFGVIFKCR